MNDYITHENPLSLTALKSLRVSTLSSHCYNLVDRSWLVCVHAVEIFVFHATNPYRLDVIDLANQMCCKMDFLIINDICYLEYCYGASIIGVCTVMAQVA